MAMEIKTLEIKNSEEESTIEFWQQFGWNLKSSQRVYNKDSHLETHGDSTYSVTETIDFTKLVFERDKNGPNYEKIARLEKEYFSIKSKLPAKRPEVGTNYSSIDEWAQKTKPNVCSKQQNIIQIVMIAVGGALVIGLEPFSMLFTNILQILGIALIVASFVVKSMWKKKKIKEALSENDTDAAKRLKEKFEAFTDAHNSELKKAREYDSQINRMAAIIKELEPLI